MTPLMSVGDVSVFTGLSEYTIRQAIREGDLPAVKIRGRLRIDPDDLIAWVDGNRVTPAARAAAREHICPPAPAPRTRPPAGGYRELARQRARSAA